MLKKIVAALFTLSSLYHMNGVAKADGLDSLPPDQKALYENIDPAIPLGGTVYKDFVPKRPPPWKIGYASTYAGNTWRANILDEFTNVLLPKYKEAGLVSDLIVTQSDLKDAVQIQQMRQMVDDGVDAIVICCSNITALNKTIEYAHSKGVPVFSVSGYVTSPYAINATENNTDGGYKAAEWLAKEIGEKGNVLMVSGIPGFASSDSFDIGAKNAFDKFPGIKIVGTIAGKWTDQVAQVEVQKFLATNLAEVNGILVQSASENGVVNAVQQSGRDMMPIVLGGEASAACYWRKNPDFISKSFHFWPPRSDARLVWDVMMRTLEGQGPKIQSILRPALPYTIDDVKEVLKEDCDPNSTDWIEPKNNGWWPADVAANYFERPEDPLAWRPKK
ncbi:MULTISPECIES: ABC transporter substrate-binding protein [Rhizobium]|jgi:ribose transport system substrate-binding protein|uniref:Monosaccharide ABC transporter substrate-binding protein, CUT2 family n=5 Tax=Rhizobium TaxID=379 RepID=A0A1C3YAU0_9HYPH|nr:MULTISPECIES: ABC transporter substrate-binding protein [Rhizobium]ANL37215.1 sugar ABC transporter substrate-binding protein [Rhizobium phaseoli]ANL43595.1 sugar ABC transporter substrate-binding protein [Rhizobium phaseoli]ANL49853.1 sugar ABC transporter substrate-binding protein [Rhizobium phaseoli]ANL62579.1 sugar ABC transporter substrate-binding protein [Rhizobium phaseoli]ANL68714.1 sugar ABC transporter substrate-binding protein [Rhizobium phaseoli]